MMPSTARAVTIHPVANSSVAYSQCFLTSSRDGSTEVLPIKYASSQAVSDENAKNIIRNIRNLQKLECFRRFNEGWDGYQAVTSSPELVEKLQNIIRLNNLPRQPEIFPISDGSIQLEWEKENGEYLEITATTDDVWEVFQLDVAENEKNGQINADSSLIKALIERFYADGLR